MSARESNQRGCAHASLKFAEGGLFLMCQCGATWMAVTTTDPTTALPDFSRRGDGDCALRTRPVSDPPPLPRLPSTGVR